MHELDEIIQFIVDALSANAAKGNGSVLTIKISPYTKNSRGKRAPVPEAVTKDDVLDAHQALERFNGDFRTLFSVRKSK